MSYYRPCCSFNSNEDCFCFVSTAILELIKPTQSSLSFGNLHATTQSSIPDQSCWNDHSFMIAACFELFNFYSISFVFKLDFKLVSQ